MTFTRPQPADFPSTAASALAHELTKVIEGEVRFDKKTRALYATDASLYRQVPIGVVTPRTAEDVAHTLRLCRAFGAPVLPRGAGTSLAGQSCNVAVIIDFSRYMNRLISLDPERQRASVEPGCVLDQLREQAEQHQLTFGPDPSTHTHNCIGGMLGNNSCGVHSIMAGRTLDNVHSMKVMTYDGLVLDVGPTDETTLTDIIAAGGRRGEIYAGLKRLRDEYADLLREGHANIPRQISGYNLNQLLPEHGFNVARALVGSEGTCVTILEAELELIPSPAHRCVLVLGYEDIYASAEHVMDILKHKPIGLEGMDHILFEEMKAKRMNPEAREMLPKGQGWLFVEFGDETPAHAKAKACALQNAMAQLEPPSEMALFEGEFEQEVVWQARESGLGATAQSPQLGDTFPGWEDAAVAPENIAEYLRDFRALMHRFGYDAALYGHFGDGCVHCRINFDLTSDAGKQKWQAFMQEAAELVISYGGSLSGEHGDGQIRAELLPRMYGKEHVRVMREFKALWDPQGKMNPGKVVDPYPMTANLRPGSDLHFEPHSTHFSFPQDDGNFMRAANRCVGIGECRRSGGGVMCPSYRATHEEQHSTRGRARLLFEMLKGDPLSGNWQEPAVKEALDLCLACKGCKRDCPVNVDMATLKAEFAAHHFKHRLRPRAAYSMGLIWWWSRVAGHIPRLTNFMLHAPGIHRLVKWLGGIAGERTMPHYATEHFRAWFARRAPVNSRQPKVILWPDTFNNYFFPETLQASVRVLEAAGYQVLIPPRPLCCGRPLYAEGMLDLARTQLRDILDNLHSPTMLDDSQQPLPLVGVEPSCITSFRDELPELFPQDQRARHLAERTYLLSEFLQKDGYHPPHLKRKALVHIHCHQYASLDAQADKVLLERMGMKVDLLDAGCCGMAGSFGFDATKYPVSQRIVEQSLAPAVRASASDTLIITNGFSCKEQILQATGRQTLNMAEVIDLAIQQGPPRSALLASTGRNEMQVTSVLHQRQ